MFGSSDARRLLCGAFPLLLCMACSGTHASVLWAVDASSQLPISDGSLTQPGPDAGPATDASTIIVANDSTTLQHGGSHGNSALDACPDNQVVIGYTGFLTVGLVGDDEPPFIGALTTLCGKIHLGGADGRQLLTEMGTTLPARGMGKDAAWKQICPKNQVVVGFRGQAGEALDRVAFDCASWVLGVDEQNKPVLIPDTVTTLTAAGGTGGNAFVDACPDGEMARGNNLRAGEWLDAFALVCGQPKFNAP
jgi:hypothetical protein